MTRQAGFLTALAVLLSPLVPLALAWLLIWIAPAFGTTPEGLGLQQVVRLLAYFGTAGWLASVPLGIILAFVAIMRAVKRPRGGTADGSHRHHIQ